MQLLLHIHLWQFLPRSPVAFQLLDAIVTPYTFMAVFAKSLLAFQLLDACQSVYIYGSFGQDPQ